MIFPDSLLELKEKMLGWGEMYFDEVFKIKEEVSKIFELENPQGIFEINLNFEQPLELSLFYL